MRERKNKKNQPDSDLEAYIPLCPVCGKELKELTEKGYHCACGEDIPKGMEIIPHRGVTCRTLGRWGK
jgi:hypothetical protein